MESDEKNFIEIFIQQIISLLNHKLGLSCGINFGGLRLLFSDSYFG